MIDSRDRDDWREASRGFIARRYPIARTRAQLEQPAPLDRERWMASCEMGWVGALVGEELGGLSAGIESFADLAEEVGRGLVGDPFAGCALSAAVIAADPSLCEDPLLGGLLDGSACAAWCVAEDDRPWTSDEVALALHERDGSRVLTGSKTYVLDADMADVLLVSTRSRGVLRNVLVPAAADGVRISRARGLDLTRSISRVDFDDVTVAASPVWDPQGTERAIRLGVALGALLACADAIGAAQWLMEATVAYAMQREVFGRVLAGYQAVKHMCADMLCGLEGSRVATLDAARALADEATADAVPGTAVMRSVHVAKSFAGEACSRIAGDALQLHLLKGKYPSYFIYGPLVFVPVTGEFASALTFGRNVSILAARGNPVITRRVDDPRFEGEELVIVTSPMFPHKIGKGYDSPQFMVVKEINDVHVKNIHHMVEMLRDSKEKYTKIVFDDRTSETIVFDHQEALKATDDVLSDNGIRQQASDDLAAIWTRKK